MALHLCLNEDGTGVVTEQNPIQTKHSSEGEAVVVSAYIFNDGKRTNVPNDTNPPKLIYTNIQIKVEGVSYVLSNAVTNSVYDNVLAFDSVNGWNIGTIIKAGSERMRVEEVLTGNTIRVTRNYTADGKVSTLISHPVGTIFIAEASSVSVALPDPLDTTYEKAGIYVSEGMSLNGVDPTVLTAPLSSSEANNIIKSNAGLKYHVNSLLKIDNEIMKITSIVGNDIQVIRGFNGTKRAEHSQNAIITCVGMIDIKPITHKIFIKNDPASGLPTQKKMDIKISIIADEEPI